MNLSETPTTFNAFDNLCEVVPHVFSTMLEIDVAPEAFSHDNVNLERVSSSVGLGGEYVAGALYLHFPNGLAREVTLTMLGMGASEAVDETEINDVIGELCNMVAGGAKAALCDSGHACAMSAPSIIRGRTFEIETAGDVEKTLVSFVRGDHRLVVELHLKLS